MEVKILDELNSQDWRTIRSVLIAYATFKMNLFKLQTVKKEIADFVSDAIAKTYTGERNWIPEQVDLTRFLKLAIDSEISNQLERKETKILVNKDFDNDANDYLIKSDGLSPEEELILAERISEIKESIKGDENAEIVFEYLSDRHTYDSICVELGINKNQLNNIIKRLKRKTTKSYEKQIE